MSTPFNPATIERPDPLLMRYYFICSLLALPAFPIALLSFWCRYITLRYRFDDHGVSMSHGVFFRREVNLTYRRIQDIHVTRNLLQRWMGLATISLQTASGSSQSEMAIDGILEVDALRDYLYARMRGARDEQPEELSVINAVVSDPRAELAGALVTSERASIEQASSDQRTLRTLVEIRDALQLLVERTGAAS